MIGGNWWQLKKNRWGKFLLLERKPDGDEDKIKEKYLLRKL